MRGSAAARVTDTLCTHTRNSPRLMHTSKPWLRVLFLLRTKLVEPRKIHATVPLDRGGHLLRTTHTHRHAIGMVGTVYHSNSTMAPRGWNSLPCWTYRSRVIRPHWHSTFQGLPGLGPSSQRSPSRSAKLGLPPTKLRNPTVWITIHYPLFCRGHVCVRAGPLVTRPGGCVPRDTPST